MSRNTYRILPPSTMLNPAPAVLVSCADPENPVKVRVPLAQNLLPMHHYVYTLDVTNAYVTVYLSVAGWDEVMTGDNAHGGETVTETPAYLGTVQIGDDTWDNGGGGDADKPVNP